MRCGAQHWSYFIARNIYIGTSPSAFFCDLRFNFSQELSFLPSSSWSTVVRTLKILFFLMRRYCFPSQGNLLSFGLWISVAGVALSVVLLQVVLAVMAGFVDLFESSFTRIASDIIVSPKSGSLATEKVPALIASDPQVIGATPVKLGQGMVLGNGVGGVTLEGIDLSTTYKVVDWDRVFKTPPLDRSTEPRDTYWIWIGEPLANRLQVTRGDRVELLVVDHDSRRVIPFTVGAITKFGIYDHDLRFARVDLRVLNEIFGKYHLDSAYKVRLKPGAGREAVVESLRRRLVDASHLDKHGKPASLAQVRPWTDFYRNVLSAVRHQKSLLFLILQIVMMLAGLNVVTLLWISANQRQEDMAVLRAVGMTFQGVLGFFLVQGAAVGLVGVGGGLLLGTCVVSLLQQWSPKILSEAVYNTATLPLKSNPGDVFAVAGCAFALCVLFSLVPAWRAAARSPVQVLRKELA